MAAMATLGRKIAPWLAMGLWAVALALLGLLRTSPGHDAITRIVAWATDGEVVVTGLQGDLPNNLRAGAIELRDANGTWLRAERVSLDWSLLPAMRNRIVIQRIAAARLSVLRRPLPAKAGSGTTPQIDIAALSLPEIALGAALVGHAATLTAQGSLHFVSRHRFSADFAVRRAGSGDQYRVHGGITADVADGNVVITEGADGLLAKLIGLPGFTPVNLAATASGGRAANAMRFALTAGPLKASGQGTISLADRKADIAFDAQAPALQVSPDLGWTALAAKGQVHGGFDAPQVDAHLRVTGLAAAGLTMASVTAQASGSGGEAKVSAKAEGTRIPGQAPALFAAAPVLADATINLAAASRPIHFAVRHPLVTLTGDASTQGRQRVNARVTIPSLAAFAALTNADLGGSAALSLDAARDGERITAALTGDVKARGASTIARMLGNATLNVQAVVAGADILQSRIVVDGGGLASTFTGDLRQGRLNYRAALTLKDLSRLTPALTGRADFKAQVSGPLDTAMADVTGSADIAGKGFARQRLDLGLQAKGFPQPSAARLSAHGKFNGAPLALDAVLSVKDKARLVKLTASWKSLTAKGDARLPAKGGMTAQGVFDLKDAGDLKPFVETPIGGSLHLAAHLSGPEAKAVLALQGRGANLAMNGAHAGAAILNGTVADPFAAPSLTVSVGLDKVAVQGWTGNATAQLRGPLQALVIAAQTSLADPQGKPAHLVTAAKLDANRKILDVQSLEAAWLGQTVRLTAPATLHFGEGLIIDHLAVAAGGGMATVSGRISPTLAVMASVNAIQASTLSAFLPQVPLTGTLSATANLTGTLAAPTGTVTVRAHGLRDRVYAAAVATALDVDGRALLHGTGATLDVTASAGKSGRLTLAGDAPLAAGGVFNLRLAGQSDLALLDPFLAVGGQRLRGTVAIDAGVSGTLAQPHVSGTASLNGGEFQDFARGLHLTAIKASLAAQNDSIRITELSAVAGPGTIAGSGVVNVWSPGMPVTLDLRATNARPLVSDLMTASLSGDLRLAGKLQGDMTLAGKLTIPRAEVTLPDSFPPEVRSLNVRRRGQPPLPPARPGPALGLNVSVQTSGPVTVRGRGIDADLGGNLVITGTAFAPRVGGALEMRRGTFSIAGQTLNFTTGRITFNGSGVRGRLDPALDFVAAETSGAVTATLTVGGYVSEPKISLSSSPQLPQDEVLARLLFQQSAKQLSPLQLAEGAQALASISGIGSGFSPLASLRGGLGLDRLSVGSGTGVTTGTTVEAGKYVSRNIYIGARQGLSGGTQAQVQVDLAHNLKAEATVSTGANATVTKGATAAQDNGSGVGLSYQFEY